MSKLHLIHEDKTPYDPDGIHWDEIISDAIDAKTAGEQSPWRLGDLACEVDTGNYGSNALGRFSKAIGIPLGTIKRYRDVSRAYELAARSANLSHKHYKIVAAREDRLDLLRRASEEKWSTARLSREIHPPKPTPKRYDLPEDLAQFIEVLDWAYSQGMIERVVFNEKTGKFEARE